MSPVAIVTDSTAYLTPELIGNLPINVLPLQVIWDGKVYWDNVDIHDNEFYPRLEVAKTLPTTSQVTPAQFTETYSRLLEQGYDVLSLHISSKLSGTLDSANQAKKDFPGSQIELADSLTTSLAQGWQVLAVARAAAAGASLEDCKAIADQARVNSGLLFVLDTLEFLHKGGRIGGASAFLGMTFNIKPILEIRDGKVEAIEKVRTQGKALQRMIELVDKQLNHRTPYHIGVLNANVPDAGLALLEDTINYFGRSNVVETAITGVSPVIGVHAGPGALGIAYLAGM
jgi:DegV family protein with EDD domain